VSAQDAKVRTSLETKGDIWVGQKVTFVVELLAPGYFASTPTFDLPDPQGVLLLPPAEHPVVGSETIGDTLYTVQRHELSAFPMRAGSQSVPVLTVEFAFKRAPLDTQTISASVKTIAVPFTVKLPPGAEKLGQVISARDLMIEETWQPEPGNADVKAGTAFTRTITFTAPDVPGMLFPPFATGETDGIGIYKKQKVLDQTDRGTLQGERRDTITYVCQRPGQFVIPAARFTWFDLKTQKLRTNDFPARTLNVIANPAMASDTATGTAPAESSIWQRRAIWWASGVAAILVIALGLVVVRSARFRAALASCFQPFRPTHLQPLNPTE
jgi:hypothetical protein